MSPRQQVSSAALELVKRFEGLRRSAVRLPDGRWTIGYGHTASAREGAEVSEADAEALLIYDLMTAQAAVKALVFSPLTENELAALTAFAFAIGRDAFRGSEVLMLVNAGDHIQAAYAIELWRRAEFEGRSLLVDALVRRRAAEKLLFLTPPGDAWPLAPSAILEAQIDRQMSGLAPVTEPSVLVPSFDEGEARLAYSTPPEAEAASRVTAAAEAVSARLQALFPEAAPQTEELPAEPAADAADPSATPEPVTLEDFSLPPSDAGEDAMPRIVQDEPPRYEFATAPVAARTEPPSGPMVIMALTLLGLAFFAGGIFWALNAQPGPQGGVFTPLLVGWLAGVAGVGFIAAAVFMLLQRIGQAADRRDR
jgi:lysozyme